eukprot:499050_1
MGISHSTEPNEVKKFLIEMKLEHYYKKFAEDGWTTMKSLRHITEKDLVETIGMKRGFAVQVLDKISEMQQNTVNINQNIKNETKTKSASGLKTIVTTDMINTTEQLEIFKNKSTDKFILRNATTHGITRLDVKREMIIGLFDKHMLSHSKVCVIYFSKIAEDSESDNEEDEKDALEGISLGSAINTLFDTYNETMAVRLFQFELFINKNKENILSITGPDKVTGAYTCKQFYAVKTTMNKLIEIGRDAMNNHGSYNYVLNNCRYFTTSYLEAVKAQTEPVKLKASANDVTDALKPYEIELPGVIEREYSGEKSI